MGTGWVTWAHLAKKARVLPCANPLRIGADLPAACRFLGGFGAIKGCHQAGTGRQNPQNDWISTHRIRGYRPFGHCQRVAAHRPEDLNALHLFARTFRRGIRFYAERHHYVRCLCR